MSDKDITIAELETEIDRLKKVMHENLITDCEGCPYDDACKSWVGRIATLEAELAKHEWVSRE